MGMSDLEKQIIHLMKQHQATEDEAVAVCLLLRNNEEGQQDMVDFLIDYSEVASPDCVDRALEIHDFDLLRKVSSMISEQAADLPVDDLTNKLQKYAEDQIINVVKAHERIYKMRKLSTQIVKELVARGLTFEDADEVYGVLELQRHLGQMLTEIQKCETLTKEQALYIATSIVISSKEKPEPEALFANRQKLLRVALDMGMSAEDIRDMVEPMHGCSDREKEEIAIKLLEELNHRKNQV